MKHVTTAELIANSGRGEKMMLKNQQCDYPSAVAFVSQEFSRQKCLSAIASRPHTSVIARGNQRLPEPWRYRLRYRHLYETGNVGILFPEHNR